MLNFDKGFISLNQRMTDALNHTDGEYMELCYAFHECKCLVKDIDRYTEGIKIQMDKYESSDNKEECKKKALENKRMIELCLRELGVYGFKVEGTPDYDDRLIQLMKGDV